MTLYTHSCSVASSDALWHFTKLLSGVKREKFSGILYSSFDMKMSSISDETATILQLHSHKQQSFLFTSLLSLLLDLLK